VGTVDPVTSVPTTVIVAGNASTITVGNNPGASSVSAGSGDITVTLSAFLDKGGDKDIKDGTGNARDVDANVVVNNSANRGISVDNVNWSGGNEERAISNNTENSSGQNSSGDGSYGEKLIIDFNSA